MVVHKDVHNINFNINYNILTPHHEKKVRSFFFKFKSSKK